MKKKLTTNMKHKVTIANVKKYKKIITWITHTSNT